MPSCGLCTLPLLLPACVQLPAPCWPSSAVPAAPARAHRIFLRRSAAAFRLPAPQLRASDLRKASQQEALAPLSAALAAAGASVSLPFVTKAADAGPLADAVAALPNAQPLACGSAGLEALKAALAAPAPANGPLVLRMCASLPADAAGAPAGVQAELQQLLQVRKTFERPAIAVCWVHPGH